MLCLLAALSGCGGSSSSTSSRVPGATGTSTAAPTPSASVTSGAPATTTGASSTTVHPAPRRRRTRAPGTISNDQVGETVLTLTPAQLRRRLGPPASAYLDAGGNPCVYYEVASTPGRGWRFCFHGQKMLSATGNQPRPGPVR